MIGDRPIVVVRRSHAPGTRGPDGRPLPALEERIAARALPDPIQGEDLMVLPEGLRSKETLRFISGSFAFRDGPVPDLIEWGGDTYQVMKVIHYPSIVPHYEAYATRIA